MDAPIHRSTNVAGMLPHSGSRQAFQDLADLLATLETTETNLRITSATPVGNEILDDETVVLNLCVEFLFLDTEIPNTITINPKVVALQDEGHLELEFQMIANGSGTTDKHNTGSPSHPKNGGELEPKSNAMGTAADETRRSNQGSESAREIRPVEPSDDSATSDDDQKFDILPALKGEDSFVGQHAVRASPKAP